MKGLIGVVSVVVTAAVAGPALAAPPTPEDRQIVLAAQPGVRISVNRDGWYRVSSAALASAGFRIANPAGLRLYTEGRQVAIKASTAGIEFYGQALDALESDTRMYWLVRGTDAPLRVRVARSLASARAPRGWFPFTVEKRDRVHYVASLLNGEQSNFFGGALYPGRPYSLKVNLTHVARTGRGVIAVSIQGLSRVAKHSVKVQLNRRTLGTAFGSRQLNTATKLAVPARVLKEGANSFTFTSVGGEIDVSLLDSVRLTYPHLYLADGNALVLPVRPGRRVSVGGFTVARIRAFDVTRPDRPRELIGTVAKGTSGYVLDLVAPAGAKRLLLTADAGVLAPAAVVKNRPTTLHAATQGSDVVVVSHASFLSSVAPLVSLRRQQGLKVAVVDVQDIYDEFSFGEHSAAAVRTFLRWAKEQWKPAPRYVLVVGDASYDPRNYQRFGSFDFVPTRLVDATYTEAPSDDALADFDDDGAPEMAVGRLPVRTPLEAATVVGKIIGYERRPVRTPRDILLVSDKQIDYDFEAANRSLLAVVPPDSLVAMINRNEGPTDAAVRRKVVEALNAGPTIVNFFGHGSVSIWTAGPILDASDARTLTNRNSLSLYLMMTCLNGYFLAPEPRGVSLGEALLNTPSGGAVAVWASSGETVPGDQILADQTALGYLLANPTATLGDAMVRAKAAIRDVDVRRTWVLLGDPLTRLR
jgi:hypothetical protein